MKARVLYQSSSNFLAISRGQEGMFEFELSDELKVKCFLLIFNAGTYIKQSAIFTFVYNRLT